MGMWEEFEKLPNQITLIRLLFLIPLYYFASVRNNYLFLVFFIISGSSDALDGFVARRMRIQSKFGSVFDSLADFAFYWISTPIWLYMFYPEFVTENWSVIAFLIVLFAIDKVYIFTKFKRWTFPHFNATRIAIVSIFFFVIFTFLFGFNLIFFYGTAFFVAVSLIEILWKCIKSKDLEQFTKAKSIFSLK